MSAEPPSSRHDETFVVIAVCVVVALLATAGWFYWNNAKPAAVMVRPTVLVRATPGSNIRAAPAPTRRAVLRMPDSSEPASPSPAERKSGDLLARAEIVDNQWLRLTLQNNGGGPLVAQPESNIVSNHGYPRTGGIFVRFTGSPPTDPPLIFVSIESSFQRPPSLPLAAGQAVTASYSVERLILNGLNFKLHSVRPVTGLPADLEYRMVVWWDFPPMFGDYIITDWRKFPPAPAATSTSPPAATTP